jgi:hypothetical protein
MQAVQQLKGLCISLLRALDCLCFGKLVAL